MTKKKNNRVIRRVLRVLLGTTLLIFLFAFILVQFWKPIISKEIKNAVSTSTEQLYTINFEGININLLTGNFSLVKVAFTPNLSVYKSLIAKGKQPAYLYNVAIDKLEIKNTHPIDIYLEKSLHINEIKLLRPHITVLNDLTKSNFDSTGNKFKKPYDLIKGSLKSLHVSQINFKDIDFKYISDSLGTKWEQKIFISDIKIKNLLVDSSAEFNKQKPFYTDDIRIILKNFSFKTKDSLYNLTIEEGVASVFSSSINLYNFKFIPRFSESDFKSTNGFQKSSYNLKIAKAEFQKVNFKKLFYEQVFISKTLVISSLDSKIHTNKNFPSDPKKIWKFPAEIPLRIKLPFIIDAVKINKSNIQYGETSQIRWDIGFNDLNGTIENLTNDSSRIAKQKTLKFSLDYLLNNQAKSKVEFKFIYKNLNQPFYCKGYIGNYELSSINNILTPLTQIEVTNCKLKKLDFNLVGDKRSLNANILMRYNNLRIKVMQIDSKAKVLKHNKLYSLLANYIVLSNDNPKVNGKLTHPKFRLNRSSNQGFFNFIWKAILTGIKESIGLTKQMEVEIKQSSYSYGKLAEFRSAQKAIRIERKKEKRKRKVTKIRIENTIKDSL